MNRFLIAALTLTTAASALADDASKSTPTASGAADTERAGQHGDRLRKADTNGDGLLDATEVKDLPRLAKHFDRIDSNHDGKLSRDEIKAARAAKADAKTP